MRIYVGVTDKSWFDFLRHRAPLDEVDFWLPSARHRFRVLQPGELFLFKLHYPNHFIVGGGFFTHYSNLTIDMAWEAFQEKTGASSFGDLHSRIAAYRRSESPHGVFEIGNVLLTAPFFFDEPDWIEAPIDWKGNIVRGKSYDSATGEGLRVWQQVLPLIGRSERSRGRQDLLRIGDPYDGPMYSLPVPIRRRLGQGTFSVMVADAYRRRCAVTGEKAIPTLDAAHIKPISEGGLHRIDNGLYLRTDVHRLFDKGYVTISPDLKFRVSQRLKTEFDNGEPYFPYHGTEIAVPHSESDRPDREFLEWHSDTMFLR